MGCKSSVGCSWVEWFWMVGLPTTGTEVPVVGSGSLCLVTGLCRALYKAGGSRAVQEGLRALKGSRGLLDGFHGSRAQRALSRGTAVLGLLVPFGHRRPSQHY